LSETTRNSPPSIQKRTDEKLKLLVQNVSHPSFSKLLSSSKAEEKDTRFCEVCLVKAARELDKAEESGKMMNEGGTSRYQHRKPTSLTD